MQGTAALALVMSRQTACSFSATCLFSSLGPGYTISSICPNVEDMLWSESCYSPKLACKQQSTKRYQQMHHGKLITKGLSTANCALLDSFSMASTDVCSQDQQPHPHGQSIQIWFALYEYTTKGRALTLKSQYI